MNDHRYPHGTIAWTALETLELDRARAFYGELFGWSYAARDGAVLATVGAEPVATLREGPAKPAWIPFVAVESVADAERRAVEGGARVVVSPATFPGAVTLDDPEGARFVVWDGRSGLHRLNAPGGLAWNELCARDAERAMAFYRAVIGWGRRDVPQGQDAVYRMFAGRDDANWTHGGVQPTASGAAHWTSYFEVVDCLATLERAQALGAAVDMPATRIPGVGWIATFRDLDGAQVGLMQSVVVG